MRFDRTPGKTARARHLRQTATRPELKLWFHLRSSQMDGHAFRRQHPVGPYILDFYCAAAKLAVELDGDQHSDIPHRVHDAARTSFLSTRGIRVLRFANHELKENLDGVLDTIYRALRPET
jgi:very-short-patch-repair endonuclease